MNRRPVAETITMGATAVAITSTVEVSIGTRPVACPFRLHRRQADSLAWRVVDVCRQWPLAAASRGRITNSPALRARGWWFGFTSVISTLCGPAGSPKMMIGSPLVLPQPHVAPSSATWRCTDGGRHLERLRAEHRDDQQIFGAVADKHDSAAQRFRQRRVDHDSRHRWRRRQGQDGGTCGRLSHGDWCRQSDQRGSQ
jgi:hypothetical protein